MVFSRLFRKDHRHYMAQGEKYLQAERYADARCAFQEAAERAGADAAEDMRVIADRSAFASDRLAELNLHEGERSLQGGDTEKALEHFQLARSLAQEPAIRQQAETLIGRVRRQEAAPLPPAAKPQAHSHSAGCSSCSGGHHATESESTVPAMNLDDEDRFQLLVQPLPGDLPRRYAELGKEFAYAYLQVHEENDAEALTILQSLLLSCENDIIMYELALILYRAQREEECEKLLRGALQLNPDNPLCYLAQVQIFIGSGRTAQAAETLQLMRSRDILADQALIMLGEIHAEADDLPAAIEYLSQALDIPSVARPAAEKLVPLLSGMGRMQEAQYLAKRYLKGCC